ncbi:MAG: hypothetical protein WDN69_00250 [Aliidongia sp.]
MGNFNNWVLDTANRYVGKPLGFIFSDAMEITIPLIILIGLIAGWIYLRRGDRNTEFRPFLRRRRPAMFIRYVAVARRRRYAAPPLSIFVGLHTK